MHLRCSGCGSLAIRASRFRISDIPRLFALQMPIRCRDCQWRGYTLFNRVPQRKGKPKTV